MMMKSDVLSNLDHIKVCTHYSYNGKNIDYIPFDIESNSIKPIYIEMPAWKEDLTKLQSIDNIPIELLNYIKFLEKELDTPIKIVSVGPDRKQTLKR